jgi:hypothetical protein
VFPGIDPQWGTPGTSTDGAEVAGFRLGMTWTVPPDEGGRDKASPNFRKPLPADERICPKRSTIDGNYRLLGPLGND